MTFQNFLCRIPKWNNTIIDEEKQRIIEKSGCNYLEDLITCVHVIQLKVLTCVRVGTRQKKIDITIPKLSDFVHKIYINVASKVYKNAYLFDKHASPLVQQKHNREFEIIIEECILNTIRDSIPTEAIVRAYLDESVEQEEEEIVTVTTEENGVEKVENVVDEDKKEKEEKPLTFDDVPTITNMDDKPVVNRLTFDDIDHAITTDGKEEKIVAPKSVDRLEKISEARYNERKIAEAEEADEETLKISDDISIDLGFTDLNPYEKKEDDVVVLNDIEELF